MLIGEVQQIYYVTFRNYNYNQKTYVKDNLY